MDRIANAPAGPQSVGHVQTGPVPFAVAPVGRAPDWLVGLMPPGYQTRFAEIQRLTGEIQGMDRLGRLLWEIGSPLKEAVREMFLALRYEVEPLLPAGGRVFVRLDAKRRLLLHVADTDSRIEKKGAELAHVFQMLHELAAEGDRVVLVANSSRVVAPTARPESITPEALTLVSRMGANFVTSPTLFAVWSMSLQDQNRARAQVDRLHAQDGGTFLPSASS